VDLHRPVVGGEQRTVVAVGGGLSRWMPAWMRCRTVVGSDGGSGVSVGTVAVAAEAGGEHELISL